MNSKELVSEAIALAGKYNQSHLTQFISELNDQDAADFAGRILKIDFKNICKLFESAGKSAKPSEDDAAFAPAPFTDAAMMNESERSALKEIGIKLITGGKTAVLTMAGGQGSRLGFEKPKGMFTFGDPLNKSLFQIQAEGLNEISLEAGRKIPWYIMTGADNHDDTVGYFRNAGHFGYGSENISFFKQEMLPIIDQNGKIMMKEKNVISYAPEGNGGLFKSLKESGALDDMKKRGVKWLFIAIIDNILMKMADPVFLGFSERSGKKVACKSVMKTNPDERTGVFALMNGKPVVLEYSEISDDMRRMTDPDGRLSYADANIVNHCLTTEFIEEIAAKGLPYHIAFKPTSFLDNDGTIKKPENPNSYKFEMFIFDSFQYSDGMALLRVKREDEFAPVKNRSGEDSPQTAMHLYFSAINRRGK